MKNNITIILTVFNPKKTEIDYWLEIIEQFKIKEIPFYILVDNPEFDISIFGSGNREKIFLNKKNVGKFLTIYNFVKLGKITTSHFKVFDPDDFIMIENFEKVNNQIDDSTSIYKMMSIKSIKNKNDISTKNNSNKKLFGIKRESFGNSWTILPVDSFLKDENFKNESRIRNWLEDQFLSLIPLSQKCSVKTINDGFYLYNSNVGMTSDLNDDNMSELIESYIIFHEYWLKLGIEKIHPIIIDNSYIKALVKNLKSDKKSKFDDFIEFLENEYLNYYEKDINLVGKKNVVFCTDDNLIEMSIVNAYSILDNTFDRNVNVVIVHNCMLKNSIETIKKVKNDRIHFFRFNSYRRDLLTSNNSLISEAANMRMYLPEILKNLNEVVYLDIDTYVDGDINELFNFCKNSNAEIMAAEWSRKSNIWIEQLREMTNLSIEKYYNSGVLFMNLKKLRENKFISKMLEMYKKFGNNLMLVDQDLINLCSIIEPLPWFFNIARQSWEKNFDNLRDEINLKIYHFLSVSKPWFSDEENIEKINSGIYTGTLTIHEYNIILPYINKWRKSKNKLKEILNYEKNANSAS